MSASVVARSGWKVGKLDHKEVMDRLDRLYRHAILYGSEDEALAIRRTVQAAVEKIERK
jgi:hypothetical protein